MLKLIGIAPAIPALSQAVRPLAAVAVPARTSDPRRLYNYWELANTETFYLEEDDQRHPA